MAVGIQRKDGNMDRTETERKKERKKEI